MNHPLKDSYDFLVIGAGPGGLITAMNLAEKGKYSVALVDRKDPWEEPVACAEAVHREGLGRLVPEVRPEWIREVVDGVVFVAPNRREVRLIKEGSGLLIDRAMMHRNLAEECEKRGVHCNFRTRVSGLSRYDGKYRQAKYNGHAVGEIKARVVVDGSGPGAGFGKGENIVQGDFDLEPAIFALIRGAEYPTNYIQMFFGKCYAPGGYAWLFPRDGEVANVGLVVGKSFVRSSPARSSLFDFLKEIYPGTEILRVKGGGIACGYSTRPLAVENLFKVGDAANMVNPLSRAGILESMEGGALAARAGLEVIQLEREEDKKVYYDDFKKRWDDAYGNHHLRISKGKNGFNRISDSTFNRAADRLSKIPREKLTMARITWTTLLANPMILWHLRGLLR